MAEPEKASDQFTAVVEKAQSLLPDSQVPGAALGIWGNGREEHAVFGVANLKYESPVTPDTRFAIGSTNKPMTATALMRLVDQGRLDLDVPVRTYIPELRVSDESVARAVTTRHLMTHSAGWWGETIFDTGDDDDAVARFVAEIMPGLPQSFPLGMFMSYNNAAFVLQGRLLEVRHRGVYRQVLFEQLLEPLGMKESTFDPAVVSAGPHAEGHAVIPNGVVRQEPQFFPRALDPTGGMWSTTRDYLRFAHLHLGGGSVGDNPVLSRSAIDAMQTPQLEIPTPPNAPFSSHIGLSWFVSNVDGTKFIAHTGGAFGHVTLFVMIPEHDFAFVMLTNSTAGALLEYDVLDAALAHYPGLSHTVGKYGIPGLRKLSGMSVSDDYVQEVVGLYMTPNQAVEVARHENGVFQIATPEVFAANEVIAKYRSPDEDPAPIEFVAPDYARPEGGLLPVAFLRGPDGKVNWASSDARVLPRT